MYFVFFVVKQKALAQFLGREHGSRGSTQIGQKIGHLVAAGNGANRSPYCGRSPFRVPARGGFSPISLERTFSQRSSLPGRPFSGYSSRSSRFGVGGIGLEPTTFAMSKQCSNQLSYPPGCRILYTTHRIKAIPCFFCVTS